MRKNSVKLMGLVLALGMFAVSGCAKTEGDPAAESASTGLSWESIPEADTAKTSDTAASTVEASVEEPEPEPVQEEAPAEVPAGMYLSELTGMPIDEAIKDQRPIAVMIDNESTALPHFGTAESDVVYELMNSTKNARITRLMCVLKDWGQIKQMGSIRSTRPTNILLAAEWNAVLCHDGGPYYNDQYFSKSWAQHFSGTFSRVDNGKSREYTEYCLAGDLDKNFNNSGYSTTYNEYAPDGATDSHFLFVPYGTTLKLSDKYSSAFAAGKVDLSAAFKHNESKIKYNEETGLYEYSEYKSKHKDAEDGEVLAFTNVILQKCTFNQLDENGYLIYNCIDVNQPGYYLTGGEAIPIEWTKGAETAITHFYAGGEELAINAGKTYIALVPADYWNDITVTAGK